MSIEIDWPTLTTGPSGLALADSIRDFIHDKFQQVTLPRFIRSVHVHSFDFGDECPVVELKDISDPLPEFYDDDGESPSSSSSPSSGKGEEEEAATEVIEPTQPIHPPHRSTPVPTPTKPSTIEPRLPNLNLRSLAFSPPDQITTPFLSRSNTPGIPIPGGTSNFSYFHLPLSAGLSGTQTPLPWGDPPQRPPSPPRRREQGSRPTARKRDPNTHHDHASGPVPATPTAARHQPSRSRSPIDDDRTQDLQTTLHIRYSGSLSLSLTAEILLDYPMPSFVGIPLKLRITGLSFDGVGLLAYLRHGADADRRKVHFCFLAREDARALLGHGLEREGGEGEGEEGLGGLLREIRVESEIGRQEGGKQVLKNVGKVEKFVLEQVRRIFEDEFVWPSFWTFLV